MLLMPGAEPVRTHTTIATPVVGAATDRACPIATPVVCAMLLSLPFGIVAMLFSLRSRAALAEGDHAAASIARRRSVLFSWFAAAWAAFMAILFLVLTTG